ncbi:hypothetical protein C3747_1g80 [Trypanosoma cruzi]|uniref:Uncharacterized protein n=1 Tax=Trypanosoma cruzi TaxID=5693 RepID=A0A2V2XV67_TRYCR|nr:hypothetical protein C3747_1g80 [Trypanosoma cruzi]
MATVPSTRWQHAFRGLLYGVGGDGPAWLCHVEGLGAFSWGGGLLFCSIHCPKKQENAPEVGNEMLELLSTVCRSVHMALTIVDAGQVDTQKNLLDSTGFCSLLRFGDRKERVLLKANHQRIVYIMCKTGEKRAWVFAMAYLMSQCGMEYQEADRHLRQLREFHPSPAQVEIALKFLMHTFKAQRAEDRAEEHTYLKVLTQVLSLSLYYRNRLFRELERLA